MLHAVGLAHDIVGAEGALLGGLAVGCGHYRTERADENARKAPHALIFVYAHDALFVLGKGARYAAFYAYCIGAVAAVHGKMYCVAVLALHLYAGNKPIRFALELEHGVQPRVRIHALIFAEVTAEAPLLVYVNSLHIKPVCAQALSARGAV